MFVGSAAIVRGAADGVLGKAAGVGDVGLWPPQLATTNASNSKTNLAVTGRSGVSEAHSSDVFDERTVATDAPIAASLLESHQNSVGVCRSLDAKYTTISHNRNLSGIAL